MSSRENSDNEPEIDKNWDNRVRYGRRDSKKEIKEFRKELKDKEIKKNKKNKNNKISKEEKEEKEKNRHKKKKDKNIREFMEQFPKSDKGLYNLIYNCMNEEEEKGGKILKNEFYKKEMQEKKRLHEEKKKRKIKSKEKYNDINKNEVKEDKKEENNKKEIRNENIGKEIINNKALNNTPNKIINKTLNNTPNKILNKIPNNTPNKILSITPNKTPNKALNVTPNKTPNISLNISPNISPNKTSYTTLNKTPNRTPTKIKKLKLEEYNLNEPENILSNILQNQIDRNKRIFNRDEDIILKKKEELKKVKIEEEDEKEKENRNYINLINSQIIELPKIVDKPLLQNKRGRGRPHTNFTSTINDYFDYTVRTNLSFNEQMLPLNIRNFNTNDERLIQKKKYDPYLSKAKKLNEKKKKNNLIVEYLNNKYLKNKYNNNNNGSQEENLLDILIKEYGYNNIIYTITGNNEGKIGENKMKKIRNGLNNLLAYETNTKKIIENLINMKKNNKIDENNIKANKNYNMKYRNKNVMVSFHYHLNEDGFIYKFEVEKIINEEYIIFKCCDNHCEAKGILYPKKKLFKIYKNHSLSALLHNYIKNGYDKFQKKMELRNWCHLQLKNNIDLKKYYIDWHKTKYVYIP